MAYHMNNVMVRYGVEEECVEHEIRNNFSMSVVSDENLVADTLASDVFEDDYVEDKFS